MTDWKDALAPSPECVDVARFGELTAADREHIAGCVRCETELALHEEMMAEEQSADSEWIAAALRRRIGVRPARRPAGMRRALYALAAALAIVVGISAWMQLREPAIGVPGADGPYRSTRIELVAPIGDVARAPNELRWTSVPQASRYQVRIVEIDGTVVWSGETTEPRAALPQNAVAQFAPGKSLRWDVQAFRGNEVLASSETQTVRVTP